MNTILISLIIAVAILYLKWFFAIPFLSAHGIICLGQPPEQSENKENHAVSSSCGRTFSEIRGGDLHYSKSQKYHHAISENYSIKDWV